MSDAAFAEFVGKWRQAQPEMALLEPFCPAGERRRLLAWGALLNEFQQAIWTSSDLGVARTKLAWWEQDLAAGPERARHPLGRVVLAEAEALPAAGWRPLLTAAIDLAHAARAGAAASLPGSAVEAWAESLATAEAAVFAAPSSAAAIAASLALARRLAGSGHDAGPIADALAVPAGSNLFRSGHAVFDHWRARRLEAGAGIDRVRRIPALRALLLAWRAARRSRA